MNDISDDETSYLPSFPYSDNPVLHIYAGLISLYTAQPTHPSSESPSDLLLCFLYRCKATFNLILLREAKSHFEHATTLDPNNVVAQAFINKVDNFNALAVCTMLPSADSVTF